MERYWRAYLLFERLHKKHNGAMAAVRNEFALESKRSSSILSEIIGCFLDDAVKHVSQERDEGVGSQKGNAATNGHAPIAPSPSPLAGGSGQSCGDIQSPSARPPAPVRVVPIGPTPLQRQMALRRATEVADSIYEMNLRDGSKLGDVHFEDLVPNMNDSLFEAALFARIKKEFPDAYGPIRRTVQEGALEKIRLHARNDMKRTDVLANDKEGDDDDDK